MLLYYLPYFLSIARIFLHVLVWLYMIFFFKKAQMFVIFSLATTTGYCRSVHPYLLLKAMQKRKAGTEVFMCFILGLLKVYFSSL